MAATSKDAAYWLLGEPESLKFWPDAAETDEDGRSIPACPDMSEKMLPTQHQALSHITYIKEGNPKASIIDIALETVDVIEVYWRMGQIPTQEMTKGQKRKIKAAERLCNLWKKYLLQKKWRDRKTEAAIKSRTEFEQQISGVFPLHHPDAKDMIMADPARTGVAKKMDCAFIDDQYNARRMVMGKHDKYFSKAYLELQQENVEKEQRDLELQQKDLEEQQRLKLIALEDSDSEDTSL